MPKHMKLIETAAEAAEWRRATRGKVGLVPTMGALHAGHEALLAQARKECDAVAASLFVNPLQFAPDEDFQRYPRSRERDLEIFGKHGVDCVFAPPADEMYPGNQYVRVSAGALGEVLEGQCRPGHFTGVATAVAKLFALFQPQRAYFGQKDAQQLAVVRALARELLMPLEVVAVPTVREADGLALSSRNAYLKADERAAAAVVFQGLQAMEAAWRRGVRNCEALRRIFLELAAEEPLAKVEYVAVAQADTMAEPQMAAEGALALAAVRIGGTRLIDNVVLCEQP